MVGGGGCAGCTGFQRMVHRWFEPPAQVHRSTLVPLAVAPDSASRHSPDWAPAIVPFALTFHRWAAPSVQSEMTALVPLDVPPPSAPRHLVPYTRSWPAPVRSQRWFDPPAQSHSATAVPFACAWLTTSRQRPEPIPTTAAPVDGGIDDGVEAPYGHSLRYRETPVLSASDGHRNFP